MNNQKLTKLNTKDIEISKLEKENNFLKAQLSFTEDDLHKAAKEIEILDEEKRNLKAELFYIKSHRLYKFIKWFQKN
jgi:septal ring factor EnvC (AmiA/AmiB activator)